MRYLLTVPLLALLVACSGQEQAPAASTSAPVANASPSAGDATGQAQAVLPDKLQFAVPSQLRSDRTYQTKKGATRRRVVYELLEATPDQTEAIVTTLFANAGYAAGAPKKSKKKGVYSIKYAKKKARTITVTFYPRLAKKPANPAAKSMVALSWQTRKAPKAASK